MLLLGHNIFAFTWCVLFPPNENEDVVVERDYHDEKKAQTVDFVVERNELKIKKLNCFYSWRAVGTPCRVITCGNLVQLQGQQPLVQAQKDYKLRVVRERVGLEVHYYWQSGQENRVSY